MSQHGQPPLVKCSFLIPSQIAPGSHPVWMAATVRMHVLSVPKHSLMLRLWHSTGEPSMVFVHRLVFSSIPLCARFVALTFRIASGALLICPILAGHGVGLRSWTRILPGSAIPKSIGSILSIASFAELLGDRVGPTTSRGHLPAAMMAE